MPFGTSVEWIGLELRRLFADETYLASFKTTAIFSALVASLFWGTAADALAVFADRVVKRPRASTTNAADLAVCGGAGGGHSNSCSRPASAW